jgi:hypothetical protein
MLITYQDPPGAPENKTIRECSNDVVETADKDITIGNLGFKLMNHYVYPVKDRPACYQKV